MEYSFLHKLSEEEKRMGNVFVYQKCGIHILSKEVVHSFIHSSHETLGIRKYHNS